MSQPEPITRPPPRRKIVAGPDELRGAITDLVSRAQRSVVILTPDLEPEIYEHRDFLRAMKRFVLARSFARVRVLITDPERAFKPGNQFVQMGQRLSTHIEFRSLAKDLRPEHRAFCIADNDGTVYRTHHQSGDGMVALQSPEIAGLYLAEFEQFWQES